ncbi:TPR-like protein [Peniophora sp. CONT]|nr:TPR-like protein [Peniophora sp. CONT]
MALQDARKALKEGIRLLDGAILKQPLAYTMWKSYKTSGNLRHLDKAVRALRDSLKLAPEHNDASRLAWLGYMLMTRFNRLGQPDDNNEAIAVLRRAVEIMPDNHLDKLRRLDNLGIALWSRFEHSARLEDLEELILTNRIAIDATPVGHPDRPVRLGRLGIALQTRFERLDELEDLRSAISVNRQAVELIPDDHPDKPMRLYILGDSLLGHFERIGRLDDLESALVINRHVLELTPDTPLETRLRRLINLGVTLHHRFARMGGPEDLEESISIDRRVVGLMPDDYEYAAMSLGNLGVALHSRFECTSKIEDLEEALSVHRRAVELTPDDHPDKPKWLSNLGIALQTRFEHTDDLGDLENAVSIQRRAVNLTPDDHLYKPIRLNNLGIALQARFERVGEQDDLSSAVLVLQRAVELTPEEYPDKPIRLSNLGGVLQNRFEVTNKREDLENAIQVLHHAVNLTPDGHRDKPLRLNNLGISLQSRYKLFEDTEDLEGATHAKQRAVELAPEGSPYKPGWLHSLGITLQSRFERTRVVDDLANTIALHEHALKLLPQNHPDRPAQLNTLGVSLQKRFESSRSRSDFEAAVKRFMEATMQPLGPPSDRLEAARQCVKLVTGYPELSSSDDLLLAFSRVISALPEIVWLGHSVTRRYNEAGKIGDLVTAAVAAAIGADSLSQAVEWLEAGRSLVWSQVLSLRTPIEELEKHHPLLSNSIRGVQQELQSPGLSFSSLKPRANEPVRGIPGVTVDSMAEHHRILVTKYEQILAEIRSYPGFEDFLRPKTLSTLTPLIEPGLGPVVFVNVHASRCDALILLERGLEIKVVELSSLTEQRAKRLRSIWRECLNACGVRSRAVVPWNNAGVRGGSGNFNLVLARLWTWVVFPVLKALRYDELKNGGPLPHITWCPTGPLTQLPLHAAGIYADGSDAGQHIFDLAVSSYTPSLSALLHSSPDTAAPHTTPNLLVITQPATPGYSPLPGTVDEGARLEDICVASHIMSNALGHKQATVDAVRRFIPRHSWVHFACHGSQNLVDPTRSAFALYDGPLSLETLMSTVSENAELAFLSACQTAVGDERIPEESAHLAAGMLAVGFKGVIATMWSIQDADAPIIVEAYYKEILKHRRIGISEDAGTRAAYALHVAAGRLRGRVGERNFERWVPFVHFGL